MTRQNLRTAASAFGFAFLLCAGMQLIALGMIVGLRGWIHEVPGWLFSITADELDYGAFQMLMLMKTLGLTLFLVPWAALRIVASRTRE